MAGEELLKINLFVFVLLLCFLNACIGGISEETNTLGMADDPTEDIVVSSSSETPLSQANSQKSFSSSISDIPISSSHYSPQDGGFSQSAELTKSSASENPVESGSSKSDSSIAVPVGYSDTLNIKDEDPPLSIYTPNGFWGSCVKYSVADETLIKLTYSGWSVQKAFTDTGSGYFVVNTYKGLDSSRIINVCNSYKDNEAYADVSCDVSMKTVSYKMQYNKIRNLDDYCKIFEDLEVTELEILYGEF